MNLEKAINVLSVNISEKKGTIKKPVPVILLNECGVERDAHAGLWHRQVSLLGIESIQKFEEQAGRKINFGEFAENITTQGIILYQLAPLDRLKIGAVELEITQIGKKCHGSHCAIFNEVGNCVMPKEGIFARVLQHGKIKAGDNIVHERKIFRIMVITLSDRASRGEYDDLSGPEIIRSLKSFFTENRWHCEVDYNLIPDEPDALKALFTLAKSSCYDMVFTTGGTGIGRRDITPDVANLFIDKQIPGIIEAIRFKFGSDKPNALLSRGVVGLMGETFVYVLPGSVKAVNEYMGEIVKTLRHLIFMRMGIDNH